MGECDTVFKVPIGLKHHLLLHTGELPFLCLHCWRSFSSHIDLKLHIRREYLFHLDMPTPNKAGQPKVKKLKGENLKEEIKSGEYIAVSANNEHGMETAESGEQVHFVVAEGGEDGEHDGEGQTIVLGSEAAASPVDSNGQDMIVVIQSRNHISNVTTTTTSSANGEMIVSDANHEQGGQDQEYISLQMPDGSSQQGTLVLAQGGDGQDGDQSYIVVAQEDTKGGFTLQQQEQVEEKTSSSTENPQ